MVRWILSGETCQRGWVCTRASKWGHGTPRGCATARRPDSDITETQNCRMYTSPSEQQHKNPTHPANFTETMYQEPQLFTSACSTAPQHCPLCYLAAALTNSARAGHNHAKQGRRAAHAHNMTTTSVAALRGGKQQRLFAALAPLLAAAADPAGVPAVSATGGRRRRVRRHCRRQLLSERVAAGAPCGRVSGRAPGRGAGPPSGPPGGSPPRGRHGRRGGRPAGGGGAPGARRARS